MFIMPDLPAYVSPPDGDTRHERRDQLLEARTFRLEQLAASERNEPAPSEKSVQRALHMAATTALADIDAALDRMDREVYGQCVVCAKPIPEERLDVLPMTPHCMPCHYNEENCRLDRRV